jgi:hypothetical protein
MKRVFKRGLIAAWLGMVLVLLFLVAPGLYAATPEKEKNKGKTIKDIGVFALEGGVRIDIRADGIPPKPGITQLPNPPRLVLDFPKMTNAFPKNSIRVDDPALKGIRIGQHRDKVRIVFDFIEGPVANYQIVESGNTLKVIFWHLSRQPPAPIAEEPVPKGSSETLFPPRKEVEIRPPLEAPLKPGIAQPKAPAIQPSPIPKPEVASPRPPAESSIKEVEKTVPSPEPPGPLAMKPPESPQVPVPAEVAPPKPPALPAKEEAPPEQARQTTARKISLDFRDAELREVFRTIAKEANVNIAVSDGVQGKITLRLMEVPWDQALDLILQTRQLAKVQEGNTLTIMTREEFEKKR